MTAVDTNIGGGRNILVISYYFITFYIRNAKYAPKKLKNTNAVATVVSEDKLGTRILRPKMCLGQIHHNQTYLCELSV